MLAGACPLLLERRAATVSSQPEPPAWSSALIIGSVSQDIERRLTDFFHGDPHDAAAVYLFGSVARGTARAESDVDVGILFTIPPPLTFDAQPFALEGELSSCSVVPCRSSC